MAVPEMVVIPAGEFVMGYDGPDPKQRRYYPPHRVELDAYRIGVQPVTNAEFAAFVKDDFWLTDPEKAGKSAVLQEHLISLGATWKAPSGLGTEALCVPENPVVQVSWFDATRYCAWLSEVHGRRFRLPTEAEWEHAARGPKNEEYPFAAKFIDKKLIGGKQNVPYEGGRGKLARSTDYPANEYGLYDVGGNVVQWCADWYAEDYYSHSPSKNPKGPETGEGRVIRGASFFRWPGCTYNRLDSIPSLASSDLGFRVASDA